MRYSHPAHEDASMPGVVANAEVAGTYVFMERDVDQAAVDAHRATEHFKALGRKMGESMDGRPDVLRLREVE
jgi:quinol monooxygenase YgiN